MNERIWFFRPRIFTPETVSTLENEWNNIPDDKTRNIIAVRYHYWKFHLFLLDSLHSVSGTGKGKNGRRADLCLRAGLIHTGMVLCASIAERVLLAHAENCHFAPPGKNKTFGLILDAWKFPKSIPLAQRIPHKVLNPIWRDLKKLKEWRNDLHLYRLNERSETWVKILADEKDFKSTTNHVLAHLKKIPKNLTSDFGSR